MRTYALISALIAALAVSGYVWWLRGANATLRADLNHTKSELAVAGVIIDQRNDAAAVHRAHIDFMAGVNNERAANINSLKKMEGHDAPLSPFMRNVSRKLQRPQN